MLTLCVPDDVGVSVALRLLDIVSLGDRVAERVPEFESEGVFDVDNVWLVLTLRVPLFVVDFVAVCESDSELEWVMGNVAVLDML